ncbi:MAG: hypothetical protein ABL970_14410 [Nitrospira sp.]
MQIWIRFAAILTVSLMSGCATGPPPRAVYQDPATIIRIQFDRQAGHGHPATVSPDIIRHVLQGMRVQSRSSFVPSILTGEASLGAAFSKEEQDFLGPHLGRALAEARPDELVTFYRRVSTPAVGLAITSGGLFVHGRHLYVILANNRTKPSDGMSQSIVSEIDPIDSPLLPISRTAFRATFVPATSMVPEDERWEWSYIDQGRVVVIDLVQLGRDMRSPAPRAVP